MTFDLVHHVKSRARSLQLDKTALTPAMVALEQVAAQAQATKRLSGLPYGQNAAVQFSVPAFVPAAIRRYRSMLEVDEPPKLGPWSPMSYEELYSSPLQPAAGSDDEPSSDQSTRSCSWNTNPPTTVGSQETDFSSQKPTPCPLASSPCIVNIIQHSKTQRLTFVYLASNGADSPQGVASPPPGTFFCVLCPICQHSCVSNEYNSRLPSCCS